MGAAVIEAAYDIAPEAEYYIAAVSRDDFYHFDLIRIVEWFQGEGVDLILFSHDGGWSGPGDGTSIYPTSELRTLDNAVNLGMTWISPTNDRALATWSGFFKDTDGDGLHEFTDDGDECNSVTLTEPNNIYQAQIRWNDPWGASNHDLEAALVDDTGHVVATSRKAEFGRSDPNELVEFTSPDPAVSYCLEISLAVPTTDPIIVGLQSYHGHALEHPSIYGSVTSPADSVNPGMRAVGAAALDNPREIQPFSGRGPMVNGHTKPDIVGGDGAHSAVLGMNWESTAQAAAHVTGMAALVKQRFPDYTPMMIADYLRNSAESRPAEAGDFNQSPDNNNTWGHGFAMLPDDVEGVTPPTVDTCVQTIGGEGTYDGRWDDTCLSENRPRDSAEGGEAGSDYYARFYTFTLDETADVTIRLSSDDDPSVDTFLYLMEGSSSDGTIKTKNDDISNTNRA